ncbi:MAG TPA: class I SAM-dependent methyltransferase [Polyangiaceae bacterium]|nr:class I SAM-dependent methyltransferase [Polyangiaceae bacterium]
MKRVFPRSIPPPDERPHPERSEWPLDPHDFATYYRYAPAALAVRECLRLRAVRKYDLPEPIFDIGCGDGVFAALAYPGKQIWGIDINADEVRRAQATSTYSTLVCGSITEVSLPAGFFQSAVANCSLEHVPRLDLALSQIHRSLAPGAPFILIVPTPGWTRLLAIPDLLTKAGLPALAAAYGNGLDSIFNHIHMYDPPEWRAQLEAAGFRVRSIETLTSRRSSWMFDILLYPSLVGLMNKKLTGKWVQVPLLRNLSVDVVRRTIDALAALVPDSNEGSEYLIVCETPEASG